MCKINTIGPPMLKRTRGTPDPWPWARLKFIFGVMGRNVLPLRAGRHHLTGALGGSTRSTKGCYPFIHCLVVWIQWPFVAKA